LSIYPLIKLVKMASLIIDSKLKLLLLEDITDKEINLVEHRIALF